MLFKTYFNKVSALSASVCCASGDINCLPNPAVSQGGDVS